MRLRTNYDGGEAFPGANCDPHFAELILGGNVSAFTSASPPTDEPIDGTGVAAGESFGCTMSATDGTITIVRAGNYLVSLNLGDVEITTGDGTAVFEVKKAPITAPSTFAALAQRLRIKVVADETGLVNMSASRQKVVALAKGDVLRAEVTGTASGAVILADGGLVVVQLTDAELSVTA